MCNRGGSKNVQAFLKKSIMKAIDSGEINTQLGFPKQPWKLVISEWNLGQSPVSALTCRITDSSTEGMRGTHSVWEADLSGHKSLFFHLVARSLWIAHLPLPSLLSPPWKRAQTTD